MTCPRDEELLFTLHERPSTLSALRLQLHILRCRSCRERRRAFRDVSQLFVTHLGFAAAPAGTARRWRRPVILGVAAAVAAGGNALYHSTRAVAHATEKICMAGSAAAVAAPTPKPAKAGQAQRRASKSAPACPPDR